MLIFLHTFLEEGREELIKLTQEAFCRGAVMFGFRRYPSSKSEFVRSVAFSGDARLPANRIRAGDSGSSRGRMCLFLLSFFLFPFALIGQGSKVTPTITWATPAKITYGTALSSTQLNATASVAGSFSYSPAAGGVFSTGTHTLSVTFTPTNTAAYNNATATVTLAVGKATPSITWGAPGAITYGTALSSTQLNANASIPGTFAYTPAAGTVLNAGAQTLSVQFTPTDTSDYHDATATVTLTVNKAKPTITWATPAGISYGTALGSKQLDASSPVPGTFVYSPGSGTVLAPGPHSLQATFTPTDSTDFSNASLDVTLEVGPQIVTQPASETVLMGAKATFSVKATGTGTLSYAWQYLSGSTWKAFAAGTGYNTATMTTAPTSAVFNGLHFRVVVTDGNGLTATSSTVVLTVNPATATITWPAPAAITYGTALSATQLDATASVAGTFAYTPAAGTVLKAGVQTLSVTFTPTNSAVYSTLRSTVTVTVNKATPTIAWAAPAGIDYGTAVSATQLDATASTAGTFAYNPASGVVLPPGPHALTAAFTPTDEEDYNPAAATVSLAVGKATPTITWATPAAVAYGTALGAAQFNATSTVAGSFTYSEAAGTVLKAGSHTLTASFTPTDISDYHDATATVTLTVNQAAPAITWATPAAIAYGTALCGAELNATSSTPGTFTYTPGTGAVLPPGTHPLSVTFTPADTVNYASGAASVTLPVDKATPTISWAAPAAIQYGTALSAAQLDAASSAPGTFAFSPAAGTVLSAGIQTLSVTFTPTDVNDYHDATASVQLMVNQAAPVVSWAAPAAISYGTALSATQLNATANVPGTFSYTPAAGTVLQAGAQSLSVTFTPADSADYSTTTASVMLTVTGASPAITWAAPAAITYGAALSGAQLNATANVPGTFVYTPAAGTVPKAGAQTLSVTFTPTNPVNYSTATDTVGLTVNQATPTISWATPAAISYGTALSATQLNATANVPGTFSYTPAAGTVLQAGAQSLSVTFTPTDSADYSATTASVMLTVTGASPAITWAAPAAITYGAALSGAQLNATANVPGTFVYTPAAGTVPKAGAQTLSVTFTPTNPVNYSTATDTVGLTVNQATPTISWATPAAISYGTALSATQLNATANVPGTFSYTPAAGTVLQAGAQSLSVTFTPTDSADYSATTASVMLTVTGASPAITWAAPAAITYGAALSGAQLNATANVPGTFVYTPAAGTVPKAGAQTLSVTFTPTNPVNYSTATATVGLTVNQATPAISWAAPAAISYGTALSATQLNATSTVPGSFAYSPAAGTVPAAGAQTLSVTFTPTDTADYTTATATVTLAVNQSTPTINWAAPAAITYGAALSGAQLNATANVPGTFVYTPAAGAVPQAGAQTLSVAFTPTDKADYTTAAATVTLTVNQATPTISWATPAAILSGTALSSTQLDATSTVPGSFAYSPAAGTVPAAGVQTLSVTFTPTDTTDYASATATVTLTVNQLTSSLSINASSVGFGYVELNALSTQSVTLTSSGTGSVTVNSATVAGTGFSLAAGSNFPATLAAGQAVTLGVQFDPATAGSVTGSLTITSTSSGNGTVAIPLSGTGISSSYAVNLNWDAPSGSTDPVAGYNVYRSPSGTNMYQLVNSSADTQTTFVDASVQTGQSYDYIIESVDDSGTASAPTGPITVTIP
jgi:hypothetical protein